MPKLLAICLSLTCSCTRACSSSSSTKPLWFGSSLWFKSQSNLSNSALFVNVLNTWSKSSCVCSFSKAKVYSREIFVLTFFKQEKTAGHSFPLNFFELKIVHSVKWFITHKVVLRFNATIMVFWQLIQLNKEGTDHFLNVRLVVADFSRDFVPKLYF